MFEPTVVFVVMYELAIFPFVFVPAKSNPVLFFITLLYIEPLFVPAIYALFDVLNPLNALFATTVSIAPALLNTTFLIVPFMPSKALNVTW